MTPANPYGWWLPASLSTIGPGLDSMFTVVHWFMAALFLGWGAFFVYCLFRFRAREGHKAEYHTDTKHLNHYLEIGVIAFEVVLIFVFSLPRWAAAKYETPKPEEAVQIEVTAEQFAWSVRYPGADGKFGRKRIDLVNMNNPIGLDREDAAAKDDVVVINELWAPSGKPVLIKLSSKDVIHSIYFPVLRVKQDAIPGQIVDVWFNATANGDFEIACAQLCGVAHSMMRGDLHLRSPEEFDGWLKERSAELAEGAQAKAAAAGSDW